MRYPSPGMIFTTLALSLGIVACDKASGSAGGDGKGSGGVAVVDLDKVATELGWYKDLDTNLKTIELQFKNDLQARGDRYGAEVQAKVKQYAPKEGDKLTPQQEQELNQMAGVRQQVMAQLQQAAQQQYAVYRGEWLKRYREALQPVVRDVATAKKARLVMVKSDALAFVDDAVDLTGPVTESARAHRPQVAPVPLPQLPTVNELPNPASATQPVVTPPPAVPTNPAPVAPTGTPGPKR